TLASGHTTGLDVSLERLHDHIDLSRRISVRAPARAPVRRPALHPVHPSGSSRGHRPPAADNPNAPRRSRSGRGTRDRNPVRRSNRTTVGGVDPAPQVPERLAAWLALQRLPRRPLVAPKESLVPRRVPEVGADGA